MFGALLYMAQRPGRQEKQMRENIGILSKQCYLMGRQKREGRPKTSWIGGMVLAKGDFRTREN